MDGYRILRSMIGERKLAGTGAGMEPFAAVKCSPSQPVIHGNINVVYITCGSVYQNRLSRVRTDVLLDCIKQDWSHFIIIFRTAELEFSINWSGRIDYNPSRTFMHILQNVFRGISV